MDGMRFDAVARKLSTTESRRGVFKTMAAAGLGLGLSGVGLSEALGKRKGKRNKGGKKVTARCKKSTECSGKLVCKKSNSQNSFYETTRKRCCKKEGDRCEDGGECCGIDVICNGGYCQNA